MARIKFENKEKIFLSVSVVIGCALMDWGQESCLIWLIQLQ